eukprot:Lankesteria_metandrocarpae@DN4771_c0_g1_i3.p1
MQSSSVQNCQQSFMCWPSCLLGKQSYSVTPHFKATKYRRTSTASAWRLCTQGQHLLNASFLQNIMYSRICLAMYSGKSSQGERLANLESVKKEFSKVVVCSDVYARGVDLKCVDLVINFDLPIDRDVFLHRCGRAGRFGKPGVCVCVALRSEVMQVQYFAIQLGISIPDFDTFGADYMQAASAQLPSGGGVTALRSTEGTELTDECIVDDGPSVDGTQAATGSDRAHSARGGPQKKRVKLNRDCLSQDQEVVVDHAIEEDFVKEFPSQSYFSNIIDDAFGDMSDERRSLCLSTLPNTLRQAMRGRLRSSVWTTRDCCT